MNQYFSEPNQLKSFSKEESAFAMDYTNQTDSYRGVDISNAPPTDINYFHLENRGKIEFWGVNFEKCGSLFEKKEENFECMFVAKRAKNLKMACICRAKDEGYTLWGYNKLRILNSSFLVAAKERI